MPAEKEANCAQRCFQILSPGARTYKNKLLQNALDLSGKQKEEISFLSAG